MIEVPDNLPPHKCTVWDYCILDNEYKLLFCVFCHKVVGYEKDGVRIIKTITLEKEHQIFGQKEYSEDVLKDNA